jgi:hypothetical protein
MIDHQPAPHQRLVMRNIEEGSIGFVPAKHIDADCGLLVAI